MVRHPPSMVATGAVAGIVTGSACAGTGTMSLVQCQAYGGAGATLSLDGWPPAQPDMDRWKTLPLLTFTGLLRSQPPALNTGPTMDFDCPLSDEMAAAVV